MTSAPCATQEGIAQAVEHYAPYQDLPGVHFDASADALMITRGEYARLRGERVGLRKEGEGYVVDYAADLATARETFRCGTVLGTPEVVDEIEAGMKGSLEQPLVCCAYRGSYRAARVAFDRVVAIFLEKLAN